MHDFTEEELAGLSDEERQAILEGEEEEQAPTDASSAEGHGEEKAPADTPSEDEGEADAGPPDDAPREAKTEDEPPAAEEKVEPKDTPPPPPFVPTYEVDATKLEGIQSQLADLDKKLEEGDIDIVEYTRKRDPLIRQQTQIELAQQFNEQQAQQLWKHEQSLFFSQNPDYRTDPVMNGALRAVFKTLDTEENAGKTGYELLLEAKQVVEARLDTGKAETPKADPTPKPKTPARESVQLPKTLAESIPADENPSSQDEFAHLDKLQGLEYEMALARLTPDQERRYLGGV